MTLVLRPARPDDLSHIYQMAKSTGGGFTNLPPDRRALRARLERAARSFERGEDTLADDLYFFVLADGVSGEVVGTCQIFSKIGSVWPFYSYRIDTLTQYSRKLDRTFRAELLSLTTDLDGSTEVGGLYLVPSGRSAGTGSLLARGRYLFMAMHRARFADRTIAELRGAHDEMGGSAFWDAVAGRFFGMSFREADDFNAVHGNQFIADLMPKHPLYIAVLPESARAAIGVPHHSGRPALRMLEREGFVYDRYIDIFDGGPTVICPTDRIDTIQSAVTAPVTAIEPHVDGIVSLVAHGRLNEFRAACGQVQPTDDGVALDAATARAIGADVGSVITYVPR